MKPGVWVAAFALIVAVKAEAQALLPDAPGALSPADYASTSSPSDPPETNPAPQQRDLPCVVITPTGPAPPAFPATTLTPTGARQDTRPCRPWQDQIRPFVDANKPVTPLTPRQKFRLAMRDIKDPFNLLTIIGSSAYYIGSTPYNPYGPGLKGFAKSSGVSLLQDTTGELIGTYAVCSLFHEDPRYFRMPHHNVARRVVHALSHIVIAQGDDGRPIPNYENFITSAASAEISNLYVPGLETNAASTTERIFSGFLSEPVGLLIAEFLPDVASHIHVRILIMQRFLNEIAAQPPSPATPPPGVGP
jgi:hypothetical protein